MYKYEIKNNHYIVNVNNYKFLIDTGCPFSFWISKPIKEILINNRIYPLRDMPSDFDVKETNNLVGEEINGFIGMDIISNTGLTIYKNNLLDFDVIEINGKELPMRNLFPLMIDVSCNLYIGKFIIDTGAKYAYGVAGLFYNYSPIDHVKDYNPTLKHLESDLYRLDIVIGGLSKSIDVCNNPSIGYTLKNMGSILIGNVTTLFDEVCVLDTKKGRLIIK